MPDGGNRAGNFAGAPRPLIAAPSGSAVSPRLAGWPARPESSRLVPVPPLWSGRRMPTFYRSRPPVVAGGKLCGSVAPVLNDGSFRPSMGTGTASTKGLPAGPTGVSGNCCISISPTTRIWNTSSSTARWSGLTPALRERPPKRRPSSPGPGPEPRRVQRQGPRERG